MNCPQDQIEPGSVLCYTAGEARLFRQAGTPSITAARLRRLLYTILAGGAENAPQVAADAITRSIVAVTDEVHTDKWTGIIKDFGKEATTPIFASIAALEVRPTPLKDPSNPKETGPYAPWPCSGTTVLVAQNTSELVQVADTYTSSDCYRHKGRMDEPFIPLAGRVCLVTADELRIVRLNGLEDAEVVLVSCPECMPRVSVTPHTSWPSSLRTLCGEFSGLRVGVSDCLRPARQGNPFFLGITRGAGYISKNRENVKHGASVDFRIDFDADVEEADELPAVRCHGRLDVHRLIRYGGMRIYTSGGGKRRKVQLRSLGLIRSAVVAGAEIYDLDANRPVLEEWLATRTLERPPRDYRSAMIRRERRRLAKEGKTALLKNVGGASYERSNHPSSIQVTVKSNRVESNRLRSMTVEKKEGSVGVTAVRLNTISDGGTYRLNGRAVLKDGKLVFSRKRCKIRCPQWQPQDCEGMLAGLKSQSAVVAAGLTSTGAVFAVVKVANGTEDQQEEAVRRWAEEIGRAFPHRAGGFSLWAGSMQDDAATQIFALAYTNWRAGALQTGQYVRYQPQAHLKIERRAVATPLERVRAYADKVPLADEGTRNPNLATALHRMKELFGKEATEEALPDMLARSTLPEKEKREMAERILNQAKKETEHDRQCNDSMLVLCNSGVHAGLTDAQMETEIIRASGTPPLTVADVRRSIQTERCDKVPMEDRPTGWGRNKWQPPPKPKPPLGGGAASFVDRMIGQGKGVSGKALVEVSPVPIPPESWRQTICFLDAMYDETDYLFCGEKGHKGVLGKNVRTAKDWRQLFFRCQNDIVCPLLIANPLTGKNALTKDGRPSPRCDASVRRHRYALVEFDAMPLEEQCAFWAGVIATKILPLRSLVFSGSKSLHGLIEIDAPDRAAWDKTLDALLCEVCNPDAPKDRQADRNCRNPARMTRLAGAWRQDKERRQKLVWLAAPRQQTTLK